MLYLLPQLPLPGHTEAKIESVSILKCKIQLNEEWIVQTTENFFFPFYLLMLEKYICVTKIIALLFFIATLDRCDTIPFHFLQVILIKPDITSIAA